MTCSAYRRSSAILFAGALSWALAAMAQEPAPDTAPSGLSLEQERVAGRYERLEAVAARLAELAESSEPERAEQLRKAVRSSREKGIAERFDSIVALLESQRLSAAAQDQKELQSELEALLRLLLEDPGDDQRAAMKKFLKAQIRELNKLIRQERSLRNRTEQGDDTNRLADQQGEVNDAAGEVQEALESGSESESGESQSSEGQAGESQEGESPEGESSSGESQSGKSQSGESQSGESQSGESQSGESQPGESQSGESQSGDQPSSDPIAQAAKRVEQARRAMEQAEKKLREAERDGVEEMQREAQRELEAARAELERILRQLREEEMERLLTKLVARFQEMLAAQQGIYEDTTNIAKAGSESASRNLMLQAIRLSRRESELVREAEKALVLLREDGSSVAFPVTTEQIADDMRSVAARLAAADVGPITQTVEMDILAGLKDMIDALEQARDELAQNKDQPPPPGGGGGQPGEEKLLQQISELKLIRTLQARVYKRTQDLSTLAGNPQVDPADLTSELAKLAERQQQVFRATHDLDTQANQ